MKRRVVVTGLGCVTALSCQVEDLWHRLLRGESGIHPLRIIEDIERFKVRFGGDVYDWQPEQWPDSSNTAGILEAMIAHAKLDRTPEEEEAIAEREGLTQLY